VAYLQWLEDDRALAPERDWLTDISHTDPDPSLDTRLLLHRITTPETIRSIIMDEYGTMAYLVGEKIVYTLSLDFIRCQLKTPRPGEGMTSEVLSKVSIDVDHTFDTTVKEVKLVSHNWYGALSETGELYYSFRAPRRIRVQSKAVTFAMNNTGISALLEDGTVQLIN